MARVIISSTFALFGCVNMMACKVGDVSIPEFAMIWLLLAILVQVSWK